MRPEDEDLIEAWFFKEGYGPTTQKTYKRGLRYYTQMTDKGLTQLLEEAEEEEEQGIRLRNRKINNYLLKFKKLLIERGLAPATTKGYMAGVKSFYTSHDIQIPKIKNPTGDICLEKNYGKLLTREEIQKMISVATTRDKAIIYTMALSGMAQQELRNLTIRKFLDSVSDAINKKITNVATLFENEVLLENKILILHITRQKVNYRYCTFLPPEAAYQIINYLKERQYGRNDKVRIKNIDDYLFVRKNGLKLSRASVTGAFIHIGQKLGFENQKYSFRFWRSHGLRRYFISTILNETGDKVLADYLVGHKIDGVTRAYWRADPGKLRNRYKEVLPFISIDEARVKDIESEEYRELKKQLEEKDIKMEEMYKELRGIKQALKKTEIIYETMENPDKISKIVKK